MCIQFTRAINAICNTLISAVIRSIILLLTNPIRRLFNIVNLSGCDFSLSDRIWLGHTLYAKFILAAAAAAVFAIVSRFAVVELVLV